MQYEIATSEADDDGFCFPRTTTSQLQDALEALLRNDEEEEVEEEVVEEEVIGLDWVELEDISDVRVQIYHKANCLIYMQKGIFFSLIFIPIYLSRTKDGFMVVRLEPQGFIAETFQDSYLVRD